jgi:predicted NAD/FAD-dependent oxidoreductase
VAERIAFAGDACTPDTFGAIHGAWASGQAAARRLAAALAAPAHEAR